MRANSSAGKRRGSAALRRFHWQTTLQQDQKVPVAGVKALRVWVSQSIARVVHTTAVSPPARAGGRHCLLGQCHRTLGINTRRYGCLGGGRRVRHRQSSFPGARTETSPLEGSRRLGECVTGRLRSGLGGKLASPAGRAARCVRPRSGARWPHESLCYPPGAARACSPPAPRPRRGNRCVARGDLQEDLPLRLRRQPRGRRRP